VRSRGTPYHRIRRNGVPGFFKKGLTVRRFLLFLVLSCGIAFPAADRSFAAELEVVVPPLYHPDLPLPLRVDIVEEDGGRVTRLWDAEARITAAGEGASVSPASFHLYNGAGNALLTLDGSGDLTLRVEVGELSAERTLSRTALTFYDPPETISEAETWRPDMGVIRLRDTVTVESGALLRIEPGTIVAGDAEADLVVKGAVMSLGTAREPVVFTALGENPWGEIRHEKGSNSSTYNFTFFTRGGDSSGAGHTGRGPVVRLTGSQARFEACSFSDNYGKCCWSEGGSNATFVWCHFSRSAMGMEVTSTSLLVTGCAFLEFPGTEETQDNDAVYLHGGSPDLVVRDTVFAVGGDDGIDTLGSSPVIERCIMRDFADKGISIFHGEPAISRCIMADNDKGLSVKGDGAKVTVDHCTLVGNPMSFEIRLKSNTNPEDEIWLTITNSIAWATEKGVRSDYPPEFITVSYSDLEGDYYARVDGEVIRYPTSAVYPGEGNIRENPAFSNLEARDLRLTAVSPCRDRGDPAAAADPDGTRTDMGALPFKSASPGSFVRGEANGDGKVDLSDAVAVLRYLFAGADLDCLDAADVDDGGKVDIADPVALLGYLFAGASEPPAPFPECGLDSTEDSLDCSAAPACFRRR